MRYGKVLSARCMATALSVALLVAPSVQAVPSFARQTGMACEACHTVFPELTHFGRMFKANAYTIDNLKAVRGVAATKQEMLDLSGLPPISLMVQVSQTSISKAIPDGANFSQSGSVAFPQQISLFYAGKIAPRLGAFIQLTYGNDGGTIDIDNVDLRWANSLLLPGDKRLVYGITANNNPTVQDLWTARRPLATPMRRAMPRWRRVPVRRSTGPSVRISRVSASTRYGTNHCMAKSALTARPSRVRQTR